MSTAPERTADHYPSRSNRQMLTPRQEPVVWPGHEHGPMDAETVAGFDQQGFLTDGQLVTPGEVDTFRTELDRLTQDPQVQADERAVKEKESQAIRSIFEIHKISEVFASLVRDPRLVDRARQLLGSDVYVHQSRVNVKPGFGAAGFYWHSDFETWHAEDGMPGMRAVSFSIALTANYPYNGALMIMPGSHRTFVGCVGETPENHYQESLRKQEVGTPSPEVLTDLCQEHGIEMFTGAAGSTTVFDCNCMHGSGDNITPYPRSNVFIVFNSVHNTLVEPYQAPSPRPEFIGSRDFTPVNS